MTYRTFDGTSQSETIVDGRFSSSGDIALADGTATQGAIYFADDKNTGIYSPSNDSISFTTAGSAALTIANNDATFAADVFIDGDSPNSKLIIGDGGDVEFYHYSGHNYIDTLYSSKLLIRGAGVEIKGANQTDQLADFIDGGACKLYFDAASGSNPSLETTATGAKVTGKLDVTGGTGGSGHQNLLELKHTNTNTSGDGPVLLFNGYYESNEWAFAKIAAENKGTGYGANLKFYVHPSDGTQASSVVEALTITGNGTGADAIFAESVSVGGTTHGTSTSLRNIWLGATGHIYSEATAATGNSVSISQNAHVDSDGSWEYIHGDKAANMYLYNGTCGFRTAAAGTAGNDITWSETLKLNHDGNATFSHNVIFNDGYGCHFGAATGSGSSSTVLDDYEEGTWTPVLQYFTSGAYQNVTMTTAGTISQPKYTKVGRWVTATFAWSGFQVDAGTLAYARVTGLPFTAGANGAALVSKQNCFGSTQSVGGWLANGQTSIDFYYDGVNANSWNSSSGRELQLSCHYQV